MSIILTSDAIRTVIRDPELGCEAVIEHNNGIQMRCYLGGHLCSCYQGLTREQLASRIEFDREILARWPN